MALIQNLNGLMIQQSGTTNYGWKWICSTKNGAASSTANEIIRFTISSSNPIISFVVFDTWYTVATNATTIDPRYLRGISGYSVSTGGTTTESWANDLQSGGFSGGVTYNRNYNFSTRVLRWTFDTTLATTTSLYLQVFCDNWNYVTISYS